MLFYKTVEPEALVLLRAIQQKPVFRNLRLVGGTAYAYFYKANEKEEDIDVFLRILFNII